MTGEEIVGELLRADAAIVADVPPAQMKIAQLPENCPLPAFLIRLVSLHDRQPLKRGALTRSVGRVGVTIRAASVAELRALLKLVRDCCAGRTGNFSGARNVSILTAGVGPSLLGPNNSFEITQDFRVSFDA